MIREIPAPFRTFRTEKISCDLVVVGGGLAGLGAAVTAARAGIQVTLVQDRPVLGGNASGEVRLWILGATSHMGNNNRWAREGGLIDEILVENLFRNPEGNPLLLDALLLEKVSEEKNLRLLLNTAVFEVGKDGPDRIASVRAFCSQNSTMYEVAAPLFCDASGDGVVGFLAGAAFRIGAESRDEFGEEFAPAQPNLEMLGHSIYFYSKDVGRPVLYFPPSFALQDIRKIPRFRQFNAKDIGCRLWWIEWGGRLDTIHESEKIKWELWRVVYGVWNHIKNSGEFPEAENLTLEWVGTIPGKRESRRFEGDYMMTQKDIVEQRSHPDSVSFGGWAIDLHPADGVFSALPGCTQWHSKGVYEIPYRCLYSRNIKNLFLAGRIISASHVAFGSTRVMATCAHGGQAVGMAAALCVRKNLSPQELGKTAMPELQSNLLRTGQFIPGVRLEDPEDLVQSAVLEPSSELALHELPQGGEIRSLDVSGAMMIPLSKGSPPKVTFCVDAKKETMLEARLMVSLRPNNHTPDLLVETLQMRIPPGQQQAVALQFSLPIPHTGYGFVCLTANPDISVHLSEQRLTGVLSVWQKFNRAVAKSARQDPPKGIGIDGFDFWLPERRPGGKNLALTIDPPLKAFSVENIRNGIGRPTGQTNAWVADFDDAAPELRFIWPKKHRIRRIEMVLDGDFDHPMESVLMGHPERVTPFCLSSFDWKDDQGKVIASVRENHQSRVCLELASPVETRELKLCMERPSANVPAALFEIRCFA